MIPWRRAPFLVLIATLAWQGVLITLPHDHLSGGVPRDGADCALAGTVSVENHLHPPPRPLPHGQCLACLAGHTLPLFREGVACPLPTPAARVTLAAAMPKPASHGLVLPCRRGPPASA